MYLKIRASLTGFYHEVNLWVSNKLLLMPMSQKYECVGGLVASA